MLANNNVIFGGGKGSRGTKRGGVGFSSFLHNARGSNTTGVETRFGCGGTLHGAGGGGWLSVVGYRLSVISCFYVQVSISEFMLLTAAKGGTGGGPFLATIQRDGFPLIGPFV